MSTIPASAFVAVNPNVLAAGGSALDLNGLILTTNTRAPIGSILQFGSAALVGAFFGLSSLEYTKAAVYFSGFDGSNVKPGNLLFAQYPLTPVNAYLRGGNISNLTLAQLQALTGTLSVTIDGVLKTGTVNLSGATSLTNAAQLIAGTLAIAGTPTGAYTADLAGTVMTVSAVGRGTQAAAVTANLAGTLMTVTAVDYGLLAVGQPVSGAGIAAGTTILSFGTGTGRAGTYTLSASPTTGNAIAVSAFNAAGALAVGQPIVGTGITAGTFIASLGTGTGGVGTYNTSASMTTGSAVAVTAFQPGVTYDSVSGAFVVASPSTGTGSTITYGSGALAASLGLTAATGAALSQGAATATPAAFMASVVLQQQNFASFGLMFNPDLGIGITQRLAFSQWTSQQNNRYAYVATDTDVNAATLNPAPASLGQAIKAAAYSGTSLNWEPSNLNLMPFVLGIGASINFGQLNGRITYEFKKQAGLTPGVTDQTTMNNLIANGYNFYGAVATANQNFQWYVNGAVSGPFLWMDSFINEIWLTNQLQVSLATLLDQVYSVPFNAAGRSLVEAACANTIQQGLAFGAYRAGVVLSAQQIAQVNAAAGKDIASTLANQGWYLQVNDATPAVRQARGPLAVTFWYVDGQAVQSINVSTIALQ